MELSPEEYGAYWGGAIRMAAGIILVLVVHQGVAGFLSHPQVGARLLGWVILLLAIVVGTFGVSLGLAHVMRTAVAAESRRG